MSTEWGVFLKLRASEFISKAEGLKSSELSIRQRLEGIRSRRSSVQGDISTLEYRLDSLFMQLEALESSDSDDEDGPDNSSAIAGLMAEISSTQEGISVCKQQDAELRLQEMEADTELQQIEKEEQETLSEIQDSATRTNQNIALISSFGGDYANVSAQAAGAFQHNLGQLSQAAQILDGTVAMGASGAGRSAGRVLRGDAGPANGSGRNFYEAANNQRNVGKNRAGTLGEKGKGNSADVRKISTLHSTQDDIEDRPQKTGGIGNKIANVVSNLLGKRDDSNSTDFSGFVANRVSDDKWHITGDAYAAYMQFYNNMGEYHISAYNDGNRFETIDPNIIEGISISSREIETPDLFWGQHQAGGTKDSFVEIAEKIPIVQAKLKEGVSLNEIFNDPELGTCASLYFDVNSLSAVRVLKGDGFYEFETNGRHRVLAARALGYAIPVVVVGTIKLNKPKGMGTRSNEFRKRIRVNPDNLGKVSVSNTRSANHGLRDPLERELDVDSISASRVKKYGGMGAKKQIPHTTNAVRNQLLNTEITRKMERTHDLKLRDQAHGYLKQERYSKEKWETLSVDQKKDALTSLVGDLNKLLGTRVTSIIDFYHDSTMRSRGQYVHAENKIRINECYLVGDTSWRIYQTVIHEMRHAYQHYAIENPEKVNVSKETIEKWKENFDNYRSPKNGCSFEEYISQPIEWDAKHFANQVTELMGSNPDYPGSWGVEESEEET